jgi:predicted nucleotide-binding protein
VIFEFGYFVAKLTRSRVCCLIKGDVSRPSDIDGLIYKKIAKDVEGIEYTIIKELKAAGYKVSI